MDDPIKLSLRIRCGDEFAMGPGKAAVLEAVARCGSLSAAGRDLGMSYRRLWLLVDTINRCWTQPLIETARGGGGGGGAVLTPLGREVLDGYRAMERRAAEAARSGDYDRLVAKLRRSPLKP